MLKKWPILMMMMLAMAGMSAAAYNGTPAKPSKDANNCYLISNADELYGFAAIVNGTIENRAAEPAACGKLTADIVVNQNVLANVNTDGSLKDGVNFKQWTPIGKSSTLAFKGSFNGQGHTISGLYFNDSGTDNVGLFGCVFGELESITIENVGLVDSYFRGKNSVGGLVGNAYGLLTIKNSFNASSVNASEGNFGGLVGYSLKGSADLVNLTISNSYNVGSLNGASHGGGLVGSAVELTISNSYNTGSVSVNGSGNEIYVGGFAASAEKVTITNSYNFGSISSPNGVLKDDFVSYYTETNSTVTNSFYIGTCKFEGNGATKKTSDEFANGTVFAALRSAEGGEVWRQYSGDSYPTFAAKTGKDPIATHSVTLHYSATESETIYFAEGVAAPLPTVDANENVYIWYANSDLTGTPYFEIPATATSDLQLYPKKMNLVGNYYEIDDADMLFRFADLVNNQNATYGSAKAKLTKDIVANKNVLGTNNANVNADGSYNNAQAASNFTPWTPIGTDGSPFAGTFDGQGHTISGLYFNNSDADNVGLFGYTSGAVTIDGVGVVDSYFRGKDNVGSLVGQAVSTKAGVTTKELTVTKSYNTGSVTGNSNVGGLVGKNGNVKFSYNTGSVTGTTKVGGLVGSNIDQSQNKFEINGSYNVGLVKKGTDVGNAVLGEGCPTNGQTSVVRNVYYLEGAGDECSGAHSMTSYEFADGFVAITLHGDNNTTGANIWGQIVGADKTPVLIGEIKFLLNDGCFEIASKEDLYLFAAAVNNGVNSEVCVKLTQDIVVNENVLANVNSDGTLKDGVNFTPWTPIGTSSNAFKGTFKGQGHTISGLYFNDAYTEDVGLFGDVSGTVSIDGVGLVDSYLNAKKCVGGLVGFVSGSLTISNSYNASSVNTPSSGFGGLVGAALNGSLTISNSYNIGSVNGGNWGGGLVGYADKLVVSNSYNAGSMHIGGSEGDAYIGGITSSVEKVSTVTNSFNYGAISYPSNIEVVVDDLVADGGEGEVTVTNSFTIGESRFDGDGSTKMTSDKFKDGTVFAALHSAEDGEVWRQYKNDAYPTLVAKSGTDAPAPMHVAVLHYSETDSVAIAYTEGEMFTLPTVDREDNAIAGWTTSADGTGDVITEIPTTVTTDLKLYPKAKTFEPNAEGYYEIATADDLYKFAEIVNKGTAQGSGTTLGVKAKLMNDIVVNENVLKNASGQSCVNDDGSYNTTTCPDLRVWTPIGESPYSFNGTFDGQGHTISGLYINEPVSSGSEYNALFANVDGTSVTIKNVGIEDSYFSGQRYVGGFVGRSIARSLIIENCYNAATLYGINGLGGLVGELNSDNNSLTIENCYNFGTIKYDTSTGGIPAQTEALVGEGQGKTEVLNSFYLEQEGVESDFGTAATSEAFADGTVALLLHGEGASVWGQKVGTDSHPNFYKGIEGASPSENGPGVIENGSLRSITVTLHYSEDETDTSKLEHVVGIFEKLPATDKKGNFVLGWYKNASFEGDKYVEVSTAKDDLDFYAKIMKAVDGCYQIADAEMLLKFADMVNDQNEAYGDACAKLTADIVVNENVLANVEDDGSPKTGVNFIPWTPIGAEDSPFAGTFDGQGHTISGLYFNDGKKSSVGLFGYVAGSGKTVSISNVGVEDSYFKASADVGGIVGGVYDGNVTLNIENVYNAATVVVDEKGYGDVGGIVGEVYDGPILNVTNAYNVGTIIGNLVGGIIGDATKESRATSVTVNNSYNYGSVVCSYEECDQGALVGYVDGAKVAVTNSYYLGDAENGDYGTVKSEDDFSDGAVYAALHSAEDGEVWRQYKDDAYPTLVAKTGTDAPAPMHVAVLHYSETDSVAIAYTQGTALTLPTVDREDNAIAGWTTSADGTGAAITEIPTTATTDLKLYPKEFVPDAEGYYEIATVDDLYKFAEIVNNGTAQGSGTALGVKAKLIADICVNACGEGESVLGTDNANVNANGDYIGSTTGLREWIPIGNADHPFIGTFDGKGHTISGLYFNDVNSSNAGLFGKVSVIEENVLASISNVGIEDSYFRANSAVGGVVGYVELIALNLENVYNAAVVVGESYVGGIVGYVYLDENQALSMSNVYNVGSINCTDASAGQAGGLVGDFVNDNETSMYIIKNSYNYGNVAGGNPLVGKVDHENENVSVTDSYYLGSSSSGDYGTAKTDEQFANGDVYAVLHAADDSDNGLHWTQKQGDLYPTFSNFNENGPATHVVTLHYSDAPADTSMFVYVEGWKMSLPTKDKSGNVLSGWTTNSDGSGNVITEIPTTTTGDLNLYPKVFAPNEGFYEIATVEQLYEFAQIVNGGNSTAKAKLMNDIVVNENVLNGDGSLNSSAASGFDAWTPIGTSDKPFAGVFDGQGYSISGLYVNDDASDNVGLFGAVSANTATDAPASTIKNVGVVDSYFSGDENVGAIVGLVKGTITIRYVYSESAVAGSDNVGGLVGDVGASASFTASEIYNAGSVTAPDGKDHGSILGAAESGAHAQITDGFNYGTVSNGDGDIVGSIDTNSDVDVSNVYHLAASSGGYGYSAADFENGTVLSKLREQSRVWVQNPGDKYPTIDVNASADAKTIVLDWTSADYSTTLADAGYTDGAMVIVKSGKQFYADGAIYEGILSADQVAAIGSNTLYPISGVELETVNDKLVATLNGDSDESLLIPTDINVDKVVYNRNVAPTSYKTVMLPFSVPVSAASGFTFYTFRKVGYNEHYDRDVVYVKKVADKLEANTPYIMIASSSSSQIVFEAEDGFTLNTAGTYETSYDAGSIIWKMKGVYESKVWENGDGELGYVYGFADQDKDGYKIGDFTKLAAGASVVPMRVYMMAVEKPVAARPGLTGKSPRARVLDLPEGMAIVIDDSDAEESEEKTLVLNRIKVTPTTVKSDRWFDLRGRALNGKPTTKGTYYHNGQKIIIK